MAICAVIFDLDGVLIDSGPAHRESWRALGAELGIDVSDRAIGAVFGRQNRDIVPILFGDDRTPEEVRRLGARKEELYRDLVSGNVPASGGAVELVRHYHSGGYQLAVGSSTPRANIDLALGEMGIAELFEVIVSSEDVSIGKPDPMVFLTAASRLGVACGDCLVIEDAPAGIEAGKAAGMMVIALAGSHSNDELGRADRVISSLSELIIVDSANVQ
jgi:HAD superfamily hydrolase (TIGR01509 family)